MSFLTPSTFRLLGLSGITGSLLFILGDLLYNHLPGSSETPALKMSTLPESRLLNAGTLGLIGCWFYTLASLHLYIAFQPAGPVISLLLTLAFAATMIAYGVTHTAYFAIAAGAQAAHQAGVSPTEGGRLGSTFFHRLVTITYLPVTFASLLMIFAILTGRSLYPRWMVIFLPVVIYLLKNPLTRLLPGRLRQLIQDCYDNFVLFLFFTLSTILLWNTFPG